MRLTPPHVHTSDEISEGDIVAMTHQGILRTAHYLWVADQHVVDLSKLVGTRELYEQIEVLRGVAAYMEKLVDALMRK